MKRVLFLSASLCLALSCGSLVSGQTLIGGSVNNGNLDRTHATEIVPGFFLPKPDAWVYQGSRSVTGAYQDGLSSEPWAGPGPTPSTTDGNANAPHPEGCGGPDCGVFYKPFTGSAADGAATVHLFQDLPATPGLSYTFTGWAGAEANFRGNGEFAVEFLNAANGIIGGESVNLNVAGLLVPNGQPFNYKSYSVSATAPAGAVTVRVRSSMLEATANPLGGGQAFVVDDFQLVAVPEPSTVVLMLAGVVGLLGFARRRHS